jgi:hypothetical protein
MNDLMINQIVVLECTGLHVTPILYPNRNFITVARFPGTPLLHSEATRGQCGLSGFRSAIAGCIAIEIWDTAPLQYNTARRWSAPFDSIAIIRIKGFPVPRI